MSSRSPRRSPRTRGRGCWGWPGTGTDYTRALMRTFHHYFAFVVAATNLFAGAWGLWRHRRKLPSVRGFWIAVGVAWSTILVQGVVGLSLFNKTSPRPPFKHTF